MTYIWDEQMKVKGLAQEPKKGSLAALGLELTTFWSVIQSPNHCVI